MRTRFTGAAIVVFVLAGPTPGLAQTLIDDFESYVDTSDLQTVWGFSLLDTVTPNHAAGTQSARREASGVCDQCGLATFRDFNPSLDFSNDALVSVWVRRDPAAAPVLTFNFAVQDDGGLSCVATASIVSDTAWHRTVMSIPASCGAVNMANVTGIIMFVGNTSGDVGDVLGNFDDIEVFPAAVFADGFESGDTMVWSVTVPTPTP